MALACPVRRNTRYTTGPVECKGHVVVVITKPDTLLLFCGLGTHLLYFYGLASYRKK